MFKSSIHFLHVVALAFAANSSQVNAITEPMLAQIYVAYGVTRPHLVGVTR